MTTNNRFLQALEDTPAIPGPDATYEIVAPVPIRKRSPVGAIVPAPDGAFTYNRAELTRTGLAIPRDTTFEEWADLGDQLMRIDDALQWWLGDWLAVGEVVWGQTYEQVAAHYSKNVQTLRNYRWVCGRVQISLRRDTLSFGHHMVIAAFDPPDQDYWLGLAEQNGWSIADLREAINPPALSTRIDQAISLLGKVRKLAREMEPPERQQLTELLAQTLNEVAP